MTAVIQEAYIQGVSTRSVDELVEAVGMTGVSSVAGQRFLQTWTEIVAATRFYVSETY